MVLAQHTQTASTFPCTACCVTVSTSSAMHPGPRPSPAACPARRRPCRPCRPSSASSWTNSRPRGCAPSRTVTAPHRHRPCVSRTRAHTTNGRNAGCRRPCCVAAPSCRRQCGAPRLPRRHCETTTSHDTAARHRPTTPHSKPTRATSWAQTPTSPTSQSNTPPPLHHHPSPVGPTATHPPASMRLTPTTRAPRTPWGIEGHD